MVKEIRILGLDLGAKRIGVALSDALGLTAQGLTVLPREKLKRDLEQVIVLARQHDVQELVIGLPRHMDGRLGEGAEEALSWAGELRERLGLPVHCVDERLTTIQAERVLLEANVSRRKRRQVIDKMAAVLILQSFLDSRHNSSHRSNFEEQEEY